MKFIKLVGVNINADLIECIVERIDRKGFYKCQVIMDSGRSYEIKGELGQVMELINDAK